VADLRGVTRLPAAVQVLLLLALLGGIVTMHAVAITPGHEAAASMPAMAGHHAMGGHQPMVGHDEPGDTSCDTDGCVPQHAAMHGCMFVMTAVSFIAGLALLYWIGVGRVTLIVSQLRHQCRRRERAPPWTVLSLFELSILRV
jgi:uncharacterized protein DUF6153